MKVRAILTPKSSLTLLSPTETIKEAKEKIEQHGFLSLPVVEGKKFIGFLSKQFIYEEFFNQDEPLEEFLSLPVSSLLHQKVSTISSDDYVESAANMFFRNKLRFIPVVDDGKFVGIVTQKAISGIVAKIYGLYDPKITILSDNSPGILSKITEVIYKSGGVIQNIALFDTEVMGIQEISIRLTAPDLKRVKQKLEERGIKVSELVV